MSKFRKKPVVIEAIQFIGLVSYAEMVQAWGPSFETKSDLNVYYINGDKEKFYYLELKTLEGNIRAKQLDWIIKGIQGEFYPCKPDIFDQTYEACD